MEHFLWVCLGSAIGGGSRYLVSLAALRLFGPAFPVGTLVINVVGSFLLAFIMSAGLGASPASTTLRIFLTVGVMGGFTTYSTFNFEALQLMRSGAPGLAFLYLALTVIVSLGAGVLGLLAFQHLPLSGAR